MPRSLSAANGYPLWVTLPRPRVRLTRPERPRSSRSCLASPQACPLPHPYSRGWGHSRVRASGLVGRHGSPRSRALRGDSTYGKSRLICSSTPRPPDCADRGPAGYDTRTSLSRAAACTTASATGSGPGTTCCGSSTSATPAGSPPPPNFRASVPVVVGRPGVGSARRPTVTSTGQRLRW